MTARERQPGGLRGEGKTFDSRTRIFNLLTAVGKVDGQLARELKIWGREIN